MSSTIERVIRNFRRVGLKDYFKQLNRIGDTKAGTLVGEDLYGNKFYENTTEDEIHLRTRWVEYKDYYADMSKVEPAWHFWLAHGVDTAPTKMPKEKISPRAYPPFQQPYWSQTGTPGAYIPYSTVKPRVEKWSWAPKVAERV